MVYIGLVEIMNTKILINQKNEGGVIKESKSHPCHPILIVS